MAEIVPVVSETLEAQIRSLLPSQRGFGEDLQASNVITPIIDLTNVAEGTNVPEYQQQALAFGSQSAFSVVNTTTTIAQTPGFYRIFGVCSWRSAGIGRFSMSDGISSKVIWQGSSDTGANTFLQFDYTIFLAAGESINAQSTSVDVFVIGSSRQTANVNGDPVNPSGFAPQ